MYYNSRGTVVAISGKCGTSKSDASFDNGTYYVSQGSTTIPVVDYARSHTEGITDYSPSKQGRFTSISRSFPNSYSQKFKPCRHVVRKVTYAPAPPSEIVWGSNPVRTYRHEGDMTHVPLDWLKPEWRLAAMKIFPRIPRGGYGADALDWNVTRAKTNENIPYMLNDSKLLNLQQMDVGTFLAELRDVRRLADMVKFNKHHTDVSDKFLGLEFGVIPMVSDIKKMYENIQAMPSAIKSWNDMVGSGQTRSYHKTIADEAHEGELNYVTGSYSGTNTYKYRYIYRWKQTYKELAHSYVEPKSMASKVDLSLQSSLWGLNKPLSVVWNIIPMSFAVDWVVNVGDLIDDFESSEPKLDFNLSACGSSFKLHTEVETDCYVLVGGQELFVGTSWIENSEYYRVPAQMSVVLNHIQERPIGPLEFSSSLSSMQIALSAALAHQKIFKF